MLLVVAFILTCSASDCALDKPGSLVGPDVQAFTALKAQPRPAGRLRERVGDARIVADPSRSLRFKEDPLLTWAERQALR